MDTAFRSATEGTFRVRLDAGMHLCQSHRTPGAYRAVGLSDATNQIAGNAELFANNATLSISNVPQIALGVFNVASMVTGQYFMSQVNSKLSALSTSVNRLEKLLDAQRHGKMKTAAQELADLLAKDRFIVRDTDKTNQAISQVQRIQSRANDEMNTCHELVMNELRDMKENDNIDRIKAHIGAINQNLVEYQYAAQLYGIATLLEVQFLNIIDPDEWLVDQQDKGLVPSNFIPNFENRQSSAELKVLRIPFDYAKPVRLIQYLCQMCSRSHQFTILDFFSGSATTAHAVMQLNAEDGGHRKFIMVQLPEACDEKSEAYKAGYKNICEIGKERIRRAGRKIKEACEPKPLMSVYCFDPNDPNYGKKQSEVTSEGKPCPDIGFRVLRLDSSNMQDVYYNPAALTQSMLDMTTDNIKPDRTPEDLLFQVMLELGVLPSSEIVETTIDGHKVFDVADGFLLACFDAGVTTETVTAIAKRQPYYAVFRDSSLQSDSVAANFEQIFETYSPSTVRKVL